MLGRRGGGLGLCVVVGSDLDGCAVAEGGVQTPPVVEHFDVAYDLTRATLVPHTLPSFDELRKGGVKAW